MYRAVQRYVQLNVLDEESIRVVKRALYFGQYRVAVHCGPTVSNWVDYKDLQTSLVDALRGLDYRLVSSDRAMYFNVYTDDSEAVRRLRLLSSVLDFSSIDVIHGDCWEMKQSRPKNKGPYYHKFAYRVRINNVENFTPDTYPALMQGMWFLSKDFFYCEEVRDLLMFKLLHANDIREINERS